MQLWPPRSLYQAVPRERTLIRPKLVVIIYKLHVVDHNSMHVHIIIQSQLEQGLLLDLVIRTKLVVSLDLLCNFVIT